MFSYLLKKVIFCRSITWGKDIDTTHFVKATTHLMVILVKWQCCPFNELNAKERTY